MGIEIIGERLRELRKAKGLTIEQVAKMFSCSKGAWSNYERGRRIPSAEYLDLIATEFGVTIDYLCGRTDFTFNVNEYDLMELLGMIINSDVKLQYKIFQYMNKLIKENT